MKLVRMMFLLGATVFAMGTVAGCGDDDETTYDAPVTVDGGARDAATGGPDARVTDASTGG